MPQNVYKNKNLIFKISHTIGFSENKNFDPEKKLSFWKQIIYKGIKHINAFCSDDLLDTIPKLHIKELLTSPI